MDAATRSRRINDGEGQCERYSRATRAVVDLCGVWLVPDGIPIGR